MTVYIEYAALDNLFLDFILLRAAGLTVRRKEKLWRLWVAAAFGTAFALVFPFLSLPAVVLILLKLLSAAFMVWLAGSYRSFGRYLTVYALFLGYTFAAGGCMIGLFSVFRADYTLDGAFGYFSPLPVGVVAILVYLAAAVGVRVLRAAGKKRKALCFRMKCAVERSGVRVEAEGFLDSGNRLYDGKTGSPVVIASRALASALFSERIAGSTRARWLEFSTLAGKSRMLLFEIDKLWIYNGDEPNILTNVTVGISPDHFRGGEDYDLILHPALV